MLHQADALAANAQAVTLDPIDVQGESGGGAGLGVISMSNFYASSDDTVLLPAYTRIDGAVFYRLDKHLRAQLNVENIFGARYYPTADGNNNITPGSPQAARLSITASY